MPTYSITRRGSDRFLSLCRRDEAEGLIASTDKDWVDYHILKQLTEGPAELYYPRHSKLWKGLRRLEHRGLIDEVD